MFSRILFSTVAAATLLTGAPALAADRGASEDQCSCCSDGSIHESDHAIREERLKNGERAAQPPATEEDVDVRNMSWGG